MLVHLFARPLAAHSHVHSNGIGLLAEALRSTGVEVDADVWALPTSDLDTSVATAEIELAECWREQRPDIVHSVGVVATMAAVRAVRGLGIAIPVVASFDESPVPGDLEDALINGPEPITVMPLSGAERDQWRRRGVPTAWAGAFPLPVPVPDRNACAQVEGPVVTFARGEDLDRLIDSLPFWSGRLMVLARMPQGQADDVRDRARTLGVAERLDFRLAPRGRAREDVWSRASLLVAASESARHGGHVLEAAARGVPSVATAELAHLDHVVGRVTGLLVPARLDPRTLGEAIESLLSDPFRLQALGAAALDRVRTSHDQRVAGRRLVALYESVLPSPDAAPIRGGAPHARLVDDPERADLAVAHLPLARQLAGWYAGRGQSREDLNQVACLGLVRAAERFDPAHGTAFHSFAIPTILGELRRHFRDHAWSMRVPRGLQEATMRVQRAADEVGQTLGREATPADIAEHLGLLEEEVLLAMRTSGEGRSLHSLDHPWGEHESVADVVGAVEPAMESVELGNDVRRVLHMLPERERQILLMRFYGERTQSEIAQALNISQVHVSRVLSRTLALIRSHVLHDEPLPDDWKRAPVSRGVSRADDWSETDPAPQIPQPRRAS